MRNEVIQRQTHQVGRFFEIYGACEMTALPTMKEREHKVDSGKSFVITGRKRS